MAEVGILQMILDEVKEVKTYAIRLDKRMDVVEERLDAVEVKLEKVEERLDAVEVKLEKIEERLDAVELQLEKVKLRLSEVETQMEDVKVRLKSVENEVLVLKLVYENEIKYSIGAIAEGHQNLSRHLTETIKLDWDKEDVKLRVARLETDVDKLKKINGVA